MLSQDRWSNVFEVVRCLESGLNVLGSLNTCFSKCLRRELEKPVVVHIDGFNNVILPEIGFIEINCHSFYGFRVPLCHC